MSKDYTQKGLEPKEVTVYQCPYCGSEDAFETKELAVGHMDQCIYNPNNKSYATSRYLGVELYPRGRDYETNKYSYQVARLLGGYNNKAYDTRTGEYLKDSDFHEEAPEWVEAEKTFSEDGLVYQKPEISISEDLKNSEQYKFYENMLMGGD